MAGCGQFLGKEVEPFSGQGAFNRRVQLWELDELSAESPKPSSQPAELSDGQSPPLQLDLHHIIELMYRRSPLVAASREDMIAAQYGL